MGNRASCFFTVGGRISAADFSTLAEKVAFYGLTTEWDGEAFDPTGWSGIAPLHLYALEINNGEVPELEEFCFLKDLSFRRISGGCAGAYGPEIIVCHGNGMLRRFAADEDGDLVFSAENVLEATALLALQEDVAFSRREIPRLVVDGAVS